jgi:hypothetical protein
MDLILWAFFLVTAWDQVVGFSVQGFLVNFICGSVQSTRVDPIGLFFKNYLNTSNLNFGSH